MQKDDLKKFNGFEFRNIDLNLEKSTLEDYGFTENGNFYINRNSLRIYNILSAKTIAMEMALEEGWEEVCYLDSDCIATPLVDELFEWISIVSDYPIATEGIHEYMIVIKDGNQVGNPFEFTWPVPDNKYCLEWPLMNIMEFSEEKRRRYRTTGIMLMNTKC